ncbi:unnamed protein product [Adineta steineri]|uniref:Uncharacterized protein n=1 Tax=Adineta steineri TaxID=433720 RepID=A0A814NQW8_9BILA|nr:unnamed protein product [Adineta steineri]
MKNFIILFCVIFTLIGIADLQSTTAKASTSQTTVKTTPKTTPNTPSQTTIKTTPKTTPNTPSQTTVKTTPRTTPNTPSQTTVRTTPKTTPNTPSQTTVRTTPRTTPNTPSQTTMKTTPRTTPNTPSQTTAKTTPRTTPRPSPSMCYVCLNCPHPFNRYDPNVKTALSTNGWCAKMSSSPSSSADTNRGLDSGVCALYNYNGCTWRSVMGVNTYTCCCRHDFCNTALPSSKSTIYFVFLSLMILFLSKNIY